MRRPVLILSIAIALLCVATARTQVTQSPAGVTATAAQTPDAKAFADAMSKPLAQRAAALKQFLTDFPDSSMKEQATFSLAQSYPTPAERIAGYRKFLEDFPNSTRKDSANLQIALAQPMADRTAALQKFIEDFPSSRLKEQAEYEITNLIQDPTARQAAQQKYATDHPKSPYAATIYRNTFETLLREKPVNETKLAAAVDGYINAQLAVPAIQAGAMNTIADRLMNTEVLLDRGLELIQKAVALTEKDSPSVRTIYMTTLGEVQFKLKLYDEAGATLKHAIEISGSDGDAEAQLFLGKFYAVKQQDDAAIEALLKAWVMGAPLDTKASLEAVYAKKHGSLDGLKAEFDKINAKLDAEYLAKPKTFEAGHYSRPAAPTAKDAAGKVVLAELFTGAECAPCVAADLAFDGLTERYDRETVAVLIYHLHIPGPDPMTNKDTEARASYYGVHATPTAVVDGNALPASGGSASMAGSAFNDYKGKIEARVSSKPLATLAGFKARVDGDNVTVTGDATVAADAGSAAQSAVLHIALVEDAVRYAGSNGVRFHALVVRKLLDSPAGTPLVPGKKAAYSETVSLAGVTAGLDAYLDNYEKTQSQQSAFAFKERVDHLDPKKLLVVAFVQDEKTKEILQSVVVATGK